MLTQLFKDTKKYVRLLAFLLAIGSSGTTFAQCLQTPVALSERVQTAGLIVEGKVLESQGFYCPEIHNRIMTAHKVRLTKIFKGDLPPQTQEIIILTQGGIVGKKMLRVNPSITLKTGDAGVFLAQSFATNTPLGSQNVFLPIEEKQGFIQYNFHEDKAVEPFAVHQGISTSFYPELTQLIGKPYKVIPGLILGANGPKNGNFSAMVAPTVTSYSPNPVNAGIGQQVTITGNNFGAPQNATCQVAFANADNGGATTDILPQVTIVSWTNTQIVVVVPTTAGTGPVLITNNLGQNNTLGSTPSLTVNYNVINIGTPEIDRTHHDNNNTIGGYTFLYNTTFFTNTPAVNAVERAFATWRCGTGWNIRTGCVTTPLNTDANDGTNVIAFNDAALSGPSILGTCFSFYSNCGVDWFIEDIDIIFRTDPTGASTWNFGPGASSGSEIDFESVAVHESGHGHQLGHVIDPTIVMNFSIGPGSDLRTLNAVSDMAGGLDVMAKNATFNSGGCLALPELMTAVSAGNCPTNPLPAPVPTATPNPVNSGSTIAFGTTVTGTGVTYSWTGPNGFVSALQNPTKTNMQLVDAGVYSLVYTLNGCVSPVGTVTVTVNVVTNIAYQGGGENSPAGNPSCWGISAITQGVGSNCVSVGNVAVLPKSGNSSIRAGGGCSNGCSSGSSCVTGGSFTAGACSQVNGKSITFNNINIAPYSGVQFSVAHRSHNCAAGAGAGLDAGENILFQVSENGSPFSTVDQLDGSGDYVWDYTVTPAGTGSGTVPNPFVYSPSACVGNFRFQTVLSAGTTMAEVYYLDDAQLTFTSGKTITSTPTTVCAGQNITFTANSCVTTDGNWNFQWQRNGVNIAGQTGSTFVLTTTAGDNGAQYAVVYSPKASAANGGSCTLPNATSPAITITVNAAPATPTATATPNPICAGQTLNLTTPTVAGATYAWTGPNSFSSAVQNPSIASVTPAAAGVYSLVITVGGCPSAVGTTATVVIGAGLTAPTVGASPNPICAGQTLNLTASTIAGATYAWTGPNGFVSAAQNPTVPSITAAGAGVYSVVASVGSCIAPTATTASVVVNAAPAAPSLNALPATLCAGNNINLTSSLVAGATYSWTGPNSFTANTQNATVVAAPIAASGIYSLTVTVAGCTSPVATTPSVTVNPTPATPTANPSPLTLCVGQTLNLTTGTQAGATYAWTGPNSFSSALQNPSIVGATAAASGIYSLTVSIGACAAPQVTTSTVTVASAPALPSVNALPSTVCAGNTINLISNFVAGGTYAWTGPNGFTANTQNASVPNATVAASGVYSLIISVGSCSSPQATTPAVTVNPAPATPTANPSPLTLCAGQTLNLTTETQAGATFAWTGPNSFSSALQNPSIASATVAASGIYSLVVTIGSCAAPQVTTASVTVNTTPATPSVNALPATLCAGSTINLISNLVAGATYAWTGPNGFTANTQNASVPNATVAASGVYSLIITSGVCASPQATTPAVTVNPAPATPTANPSPLTLCAGQTLTLTTETQAGATYAWTGPNSFSSAVQNPTIAGATVAASGIYSLTVSIGACAAPQVTTANVTVNTTPGTPVVTALPASLCAGQDINLTSNLVAGATYSWTGPNGFTSAVQNPTITGATVAASGVYSLVITSGVCASPQATTAAVTVTPAPAAPTANATPLALCAGQALNLTTATQAGATYAWTGPNSFSSALQNPTIASTTVAESGIYSLIVTIGACSSPQVVSFPVVVSPTPTTPTATATPTTLCAGLDINLSTGAQAGATYAWTGPNSFTSALQNPTVTAATVAASGVYSLVVSIGACAAPQVTTASVTVNPSPTATANNNGPLCAGQTLNLTATTVAGATYAWSGPASFSSAIQNPTIASVTAANNGTYTLTVTAAGCASTATTPVFVISAAPTAMAAPTTLCSGQTLNLTAPTIAGATYAWTGPNSFTSAAQNPSIASATVAASGVYSLVVTISGCTSPVATTPNVTVNATPAAPTATANPNPICSGQTLSLAATTIAGATYAWTGPNAFASAVQNPTIVNITPAGASVYSVTATVGGCTSPVATTPNVVVNTTPAAPTATATPATLCSGQTLNLAATTIAGATYAWTGPNGFTSAVQNPTIAAITAAGAGVYSVTATVSGCASPMAMTTNVTVNATPATPIVGNNGPVCSGLTLNLTANTVAGASYMWTGPSAFTSITQNPSIPGATAINAGVYSLTITAAGCASPQATTTVSITPPLTAPAPTANTPICTGSTLMLTTSTVPGVTYSWSGPNGFSSALQNPSIPAVTTSAGGNYTVTISTPGCLPASGSVSVSVINAGGNPNPNSNSPVCAGNGVSFTAAPLTGASYNWSGPNAFSSNVQNPTINNATPLASGVYTLMVMVGGCPPIINTLNVTVDAAPVAVASSNTPVCGGNPLNLTASTVAGAMYMWSGPNGFSSNVQNPTIAGATTLNTGTYFLTVSTPACGSVSALTVVNVVGMVTAAIGSNSPLTVGQTLNLTSSNIAGATYAWTGPNGFVSNVQNPSLPGVTLSAGGLYSLALSLMSCPMPVVTTNVVVNPGPPPPTVGNNGPLCAGQTLLLTAQTLANTTYQWAGPNGFFSFQQNPIILNATVAQSGIYTLTATTGGVPQTPVTTTVVINPKPTLTSAGNNGPLCAGQTLNLTTNTVAGATYMWNGPNGFTSALQNPTITGVTAANAGTYIVTASIGGCMSAPVTTTFTLNISPAPITAGNNGPLCSGQTLNLTSTWIVGATYTWSGPGGFTSAIQNPSITNAGTNVSGTYSVTLTASNGCSTPVATTVVTVNATPTASASNSGPVCAGGTVTLNATTVPGATYTWTGPNGFSSAVQNALVTSMSSAKTGIYTLTVTLGNCTALATTTVGLLASPPPASATANFTTLCAGQTLNLSATTIAGATYAWSGPNLFSSALQNPTIAGATVAASGTYTLTVTVSGCASATPSTIAIAVNPVPAAPVASSNTPVCSGMPLNLTASTLAGATYTWSGPGGFTSNLQNPMFPSATVGQTGTYSVNVTMNGCTSTNGTTAVVVNATPAAPTASNNGPICAGSPLNLTASTIAGATYAWTGPNAFTSALQNPSIPAPTVVATGSYSVMVTVGGCMSPSSGITFATVNAIPATPTITTNSPVCSGQTLNLATTPVTGASYAWVGPNGFTANTSNPVIANVTTAATGTYSLKVTVNGCAGTQATAAVTVNATPANATVGNNGPICAGATLNLTASTIAGATYMWAGPNGFTSAAQNPSITGSTVAASGVYTLTVSTASGCMASATQTTTAVVNAIPAAPTAGSNSPICAGTPLFLTATVTPGATYNWTGPNSFTSNLQSPSIPSPTASAAGVYSVTVTMNGCTSAGGTTSVVVNLLPTNPTVNGSSPICEGATINLTANNLAGATFMWTGPNGYMSNAQNPTIPNATVNMSGTYSLKVTVNGCTSTTFATKEILVNPRPTASIATSNGAPLCAGGTLQLSASTVTGATYGWVGPNVFSSALQNPSITSVTTAASGVYTLTTTLNGCTAVTTTTTTVNILPKPTITVTSSSSAICMGNPYNLTFQLTGSGPWTVNYTENSVIKTAVLGDGASLSPFNATYPLMPTATTTYTVTGVMDATGCTNTSASTIVVTVNAKPTLSLNAASTTICAGQSTTYALTLTGKGPWSVPFSLNGVAQTPLTLGNAGSPSPSVFTQTVTPTANTTYSFGNVTDGNACSYTSGQTFTVDVVPAPTFTLTSVNSTICAGQPVMINATLTGTGPWTVAYTANGAPKTMTVGNSQSPSPSMLMWTVMPTVTTTYTFTGVSSANGCNATAAGSFVVTVNAVPTAMLIGGQTTVCAGSMLNLDVQVTGKGPWMVAYMANGVAQAPITLGNAGSPSPSTFQTPVMPMTNTTYTIISVTDGNNCGGTVMSGSSIIVNTTPTPTAQLTSQNVTVCSGQPVTFTVVLTGQGPWTIQYNENAAVSTMGLGSAFSPSPSTFTLTFTPMMTTTYRLIGVTTGQCSASGAFGIFTATVNPTPSFAFTNLTNLNICMDGTANLPVSVTGTGPWTVTYTANGVPQTTSLGNAGSPSPSTFVIPVTPTVNTTYTLTSVTSANSNCMAMAQAGSLVVNILPAITATLTGAGAASICEGQTAILNVSVTGAGPWTVGLNGSGGFAQSFTLGTSVSPSPSTFTLTVSPMMTTTYTLVTVSNGLCSGMAAGQVVITVKPRPQMTGLTGPNGATAVTSCAGSPVTMSVALSGKGPWMVNYTANGAPKQISLGSVNSPSPTTLTFVVAPTTSTTYTITSVADGNGCSTGAVMMNNTVTVTVNPKPTAIFNGPSIVTICNGDVAQLNIALSGKGPWTINYTEGGLPLVAVLGSVNSPSPTVLPLNVFPTVNNTNYTLVSVTDGNGCTNSGGTTRLVRVRPRPTATIVSAMDTSICTGTMATIRLRFTGAGPWTLNYAINDSISLIPAVFGTTNSPSPSTFTWTASPTANTTYYLEGVGTNNGCVNSATDSIRVTVLPLNNSTAFITGVNNPICQGTTANFPVILTGVAPWQISYSENGGTPFIVSGITASPYTLTVTPTAPGTRSYSLVSVIGSGPCPVAGTVSGFAIVNVNPATSPTAMLSASDQSGPFCIGGPVTANVALTGTGPWTIKVSENGGAPVTFSGITASPYVLTVMPSATGNRTFTITQVSDSAPCTLSAPGTGSVVFNVTANSTATASLSGAANLSVCPGQTATLSVSFTGTAPWTFTYKENGGAPITVANVTASPYTLTVVPTGSGARTFTLGTVADVAPCGSGNVNGQAIVTVQSVTQPTAALSGFVASACFGQPVTFSVSLSGTAPWTIVYTENGLNPTTIGGVTASPYTLTVTPTALGFRTYSLTSVTDGSPCPQGATIGSASATVSANVSPTAVLSGSIGSCDASPVTLTVNLTGTAPWTIVYLTNGVNPQTVTAVSSPFSLTVTPVNLGVTSYTLASVSDASACGTGSASGSATVTRLTAPTISVVNKTDVNCGSASGGFVVSAGTGFLYSLDGVNFTNGDGIFSGLSAGTYTVTAKNGNCIATTTIVVGNVTAPPTITSISNITDFSMLVTWTALPGALSYNVLYRPLGSSGNFTSQSVSGANNSVTLTGLQPATTYEVKVEAICGAGGTPVSSGFSPTQNATTLPQNDPTGCNLPGTLSISNITTSSALVSWNVLSSVGPVCYVVNVGPINVNQNSWASYLVPHPQSSVNVTGLTSGTQYGAIIRTNCSLCSARSGVRSIFSPVVNFTTPGGKDALEAQSLESTDFSIYPNPNRGRFTLSITAPSATDANVRITDLTGRVVFANDYSLESGLNTLPIDLTAQAAGVYMVEYKDANGAPRQTKVVVN